jgi:hypothetical protein
MCLATARILIELKFTNTQFFGQISIFQHARGKQASDTIITPNVIFSGY